MFVEISSPEIELRRSGMSVTEKLVFKDDTIEKICIFRLIFKNNSLISSFGYSKNADFQKFLTQNNLK
jgi:hypothetical protein